MKQKHNKKISIICGIFRPEIGGPATYIRTIAPELINAGFDAKVITRSNKSRYPEDKELKFKILRVKNSFLKPVSYAKLFLKILNNSKKDDLIFAQGPVSAGYPSYLANRFLKKKFVVKITGDYAWEQYSLNNPVQDVIDFQDKKISGKFKRLRDIQKLVTNAADTVIVPSNFLSKVVQHWGVKEDKIKVVYNSVNFRPLNMTKEEARTRIGIHGNIILTIGRLVPWKGYKLLLKIMPELLKENQFFRLVIVGDGPEMADLEIIRKNLGLTNKVYLVGRKSHEELKVYLAAADMFVLNTLYEGFSHQLLEAMASGVPVITTNVGGNTELVKQGENGFLVRYNDELNLIEAIKAVFSMEELRKRLINLGKLTVKGFPKEKMVKETIEVLKL